METLKKILGALCISALLVSVSNASWLSDFLSSANISVTKEAGGYYKTQASGFLTGGSVRVRWTPMGPIQFFNWQPPSVNVGCNGIDATWGSFSYMNFDQLVEKLKKLSTAAPAFATQLALSTLCKDCQAILGELEAVANSINSLNFDACEIAMNTAKNVGESLNKSILGGKYADFTEAAKKKITKGKEAVQEWAASINAGIKNLDYNYNSPSNREQEQGTIIEMAHDNLKKNNTYVLKTIRKLLKIDEGNDEDEVDFIRALYGDFVGYMSDGGVTLWTYIPPSIETTNFIKTFWIGDENASISYVRYKKQTCDKDAGCQPLEKSNPETKELKGNKFVSFKKINNEAINTIVENINAGKSLSQENLNFINVQSIPLLDMLNLYASGRLQQDETITEQISLTMFKLAMEDLNSEVQQTISRTQGNNAVGRAKNSDNPVYKTAISAFEKTRNNFLVFFNTEFQKASKEVQNKTALIELIRKELKNGLAQLHK